MDGTSKQNQRRSTRRKGYYATLVDRVKINKLITHAQHADSPKVKALLQLVSK